MIQAVVGANWGDEGKGKITDSLAGRADVVVRFQGGANAGHTIVNQYGKFAMHMLPSGVFHPQVVNVIGAGVALNIPKLTAELEALKQRGVPTPQLMISDRCQVVMPYHILLDQAEERRLAGRSFGSTQSGIAPFYSDKYAKIGFQVSELFLDDEALLARIRNVCDLKNALLVNLYHLDPLVPEELLETMHQYRDAVKPYAADVASFMDQALKQDQNILLEGQLGTLKDPDNGIYPMVTSSSTLAAYGAISVGVAPYAISRVIAVNKAYSSAVGAGAFVSELFGEPAVQLRDHGGDGGEYGATTGRPRRVGWYDCVASRYGCRIQGATDVALTVIDDLGYLDEIPVCVAYRIDGKETKEFPVTRELEKAEPVYVTLPGWKCDIRGIRRYEDLPEACRRYIEFIEAQIGFPVTLISNGPAREDLFSRESPLKAAR
jgi:adenylosuccinate synthase